MKTSSELRRESSTGYACSPNRPSRGERTTPGNAALVQALFILCATLVGVSSAPGQTATWIGGNTNGSWSNTNNWSPKAVPLNGSGSNYTVVVPDSTSLRFDVVGGGAIDALSFGVGSRLLVTNGQPLTVNGTAVLKGQIQASGGGSGFQAPANTVVLSSNPQFLATNGATIAVGGSTYSWDRAVGSATLLAAVGTNSSVDLHGVSSMVLNGSGNPTYSIAARSNGVVDLSALANLTGPGSGGMLEMTVDSGGQLKLDSARQLSQNLRFNLGVPVFQLPQAVSMDSVTINQTTTGELDATNLARLTSSTINAAANGLFNLPALVSIASSTINVSTGGVFNVPILNTVTNSTVSLSPGAVFSAPALWSLDSVPVTLTGSGSFQAPNLVSYVNSALSISPGRDFQMGMLTNIYSSTIAVSGGLGFQIGALTYEMPPWPAWNSSAAPRQSLFLADGSGSLLDLSSLNSVRVSGVGKPWYSGGWRYDGVSYSITATNQGVVNLSGLETAYGADPVNYNGNDWLAFQVSSGGTIQLPNLKLVTRRTRFDLQVPQFAIPMLQSVDHTLFNLPDGGRVDLLSLTNFDTSWITFGFNSTFNAPQLRNYVNSELNLVPGQILTTPPFTNIYASRLAVSSGVTLVVGAPGYDCPADWQVSPTLFSADGAGSLLDLSSMQTLVTHGGNSGGWMYSVTANNGGTVDLSGLRSAVGPDPASYSGDDWLQFSLQNSGTIRLTNLQQVSGQTRFVLGVGTRLDLPNLTRLANGASINFGSGAVFNAPSLVELVNSTVSIVTPGSFIVPALTNVSSASLSVSGGSVLHIAADHYEVPPTAAWDSSSSIRTPSTLFSADGPGSLMDVSAMKWIRVYGVGKPWYNGGWHYDAWNYSVSAANQGLVDLSQLDNIYGADPNNYNGIDWLSFTAQSGGTIQFGTASVYQRARFSTTDPDSTLDFGGLYLRAPAALNLGPATLMRVRGDFLFENTDTNALTADLATLVMDGAVPQCLEVGGRDVGPAPTFMQGNFGFGQLVAGRTNQQSIVRLIDSLDNGFRSPSGGAEALYLYGLGGQGLRLLSGSRLLLGYLNCYALVSGLNVNLQTLIPTGSNSVAFDGGFIGNVGGPSITNMTPGVAVTPAVSSVDITFNIPIQAASFTTADVQITGPGGSVTPSGVAVVTGTTWRISFPSQSADGTYTVKVGPNINELAGNFLGMDQNGDGRSGDGTNDVFTGTFVIDGTPPVLLAAYALQGGTRVGLTFNEPVAAAFATNATNYSVNGATPARAVLLTNGLMVSLTVAPLLGDSFAITVSNQTDLLGNSSSQSLAGNILTLQSAVLGTAGTDPLEAGSTTPFNNATFQELAGGTSIGGTADHGRFTYEPRAGDFDIRLRLESLTRVGSFTEAGLMARESTNANSRWVYANVEYGTGFNRHIAGFRQATGGSAAYWPNGSYTNPVAVPNAWMRLRREGDIFRAFCGTNGQDWIEYARFTNSLPQALLVGMASSAVNNSAGQFTTAAYRDYSDITPYIVTQPQSQAVASGLPVVFGVNVRGLPTLAYQWYFNGVPVSGANSSLLTLNNVAVTNAGDYRCVITNSYGSATSLVATLVVDGVGTGGFEADLMPQPNGDNASTISDWVKTGRLVAGLDTVLNSSEFQRVDCAPRMTLTNLTLGDGRLTVADWTQAGRYAAGLDPLTPAGGPMQAAQGQPAKRYGATPDSIGRNLTVASLTAWQGAQIEVPVLLNGAEGNENALGFSLTFDAARLAYQGVTLGKDAAGASLVPNALHAPDGQLGLALALPADETLGSGSLEVARVRFTAVGPTGLAALQLTQAPVVCELVDTVANPLAMELISGTVQVVSAPGFTSVQLLPGGGLQLMLSGPEGQTCQLQASTNLTDWVTLSTNVLGSVPLPLVDQTAPSGKCRFYRLAPVQ